MTECKLECMEGSGDEGNAYGKPLGKYNRPNKPTAWRFKGRAMAKGVKGKSQVIMCE